ncbi:hypothetical protein Cgig2_026117 [Carnegiea gigantea]|uniref:Uncharacterized protein n=1 Tax=Carnegiea gigantea TaxID=171969 RepID=A0A9Q1GP56_9CARY|nr:hypothetical protein Cgig2_026117 [Carnegiea gigantea]
MVEMICSQVDGGEEFKRNFIVFVVSSCINGNQRGEVNYLLCYLDWVVFKFPTLRRWTNDKVQSREEQEFEVGFGKGALEDCLDETERPDKAQVVHEEEPSNVTPEAAAEAEHDTVRSKIKALLEDAKKASNEIITNTRVLAGVITKLEKLVPEAHASLKRVRTIAVHTTTDTLFVETTLLRKSKSTKPVLSPNPYELEDFFLALSQEENEPTTTHLFIHEAEHEEENVAPATGVVIRELDVDVPLSKLCWQRQSHYRGSVKKTKNEVHVMQHHASANSVALATGIVIRELDANVPLQDVLEASYVGKGKGILQETNNEVQAIQQHASANSFLARVIVVDHYSSFSSKECLRDRQVLALR